MCQNKMLPFYIEQYLKDRYPNNEFVVEYYQTCDQIQIQNNQILYAQIYGSEVTIEILDNQTTEQTLSTAIGKTGVLSPFMFIRSAIPETPYQLIGFKISFKNDIWF